MKNHLMRLLLLYIQNGLCYWRPHSWHSCDATCYDNPIQWPTKGARGSLHHNWAHGVVVSHPLRMRKAMGSNPSASIVIAAVSSASDHLLSVSLSGFGERAIESIISSVVTPQEWNHYHKLLVLRAVITFVTSRPLAIGPCETRGVTPKVISWVGGRGYYIFLGGQWVGGRGFAKNHRLVYCLFQHGL